MATRSEPVLLPSELEVVTQSPAAGRGAGYSLSGEELPTIVVALPAAQVGVHIDWGSSETSIDSDDMLSVEKVDEISLDTSDSIMKILFEIGFTHKSSISRWTLHFKLLHRLNACV